MNRQTSDDMVSRYRRLNRLLEEWKTREGLSEHHITDMGASIVQRSKSTLSGYHAEVNYGYEWLAAILRPAIRAVDQSQWWTQWMPRFKYTDDDCATGANDPHTRLQTVRAYVRLG